MRKFSTTLREEQVEIDGQIYTVRSASGAAARAWNEAKLAGAEMEFNDDETRKMRNLASLSGAESLLISLCLVGPDGKLVSRDVIEGWPAEVQKGLFDVCRELSPALFESESDLDSLKKQRERLDSRIARTEMKLKNRTGATAG